MKTLKKIFSFLFLASSLAVAATAQKPDDDVIKVESSIVRLNVGVADRQGRPITNLTRENFTLYEDGVKQSISRFEPVVAPFSVVMLLDMSGSTKSFRENIQFAAARFIDALAPDDRVAIIEFYDKVNLLNDFTNNRKSIFNSIKSANGAGSTNLYKALNLALEKLGSEGKRRKAIVVLTDGIDTPMQSQDRQQLNSFTDENQILSAIKPEANETFSKLLNRADAQGVTVYPLALPTGDPKRLADPTPKQIAMFSAARNRLEIMAQRTGGALSAINNLEDMGKIYASVAAELRALYTVEYAPLDTKRSGAWRAIKIEVDDAALVSRTRPGYFAK